MNKALNKLKNIVYFSKVYKDFLRGSELSTLITNIETMCIKSKFKWEWAYSPEEKCYYLKIGGVK